MLDKEIINHDNIKKRKKDSEKKILKCPECFSIPEILDNNDGYYEYKCRNNHTGKLLLNELLDKYSVSDILFKCIFCNKTNSKDNLIILFYCFKCKKTICSKEKCLKRHREKCDEDINNFIYCNNLTSICNEHKEKLILYCSKCDINICEKCKGHKGHNIKFINEMIIDEQDIKLYKYKIEFNNNYLNYIENEINKFKMDWRDNFEKEMNDFEERVKLFLDKNRN